MPMPMLVTRALAFATQRSARSRCRGDTVSRRLFSAPRPPTATSGAACRGQRHISGSAPLHAPAESGDGEGGDETGKGKGRRGELSDEKRAIIERWMRWNTAKTWRYEPNPDLIAKIGKEGSPLDQFRDLVPMEKRELETVGRSWSVKELRRKSYDDLHKLWLVLYKEKNMLLTESNLARRHGYEMVQPERRKKVRKSMGAIKVVLGERKRKKIADHRAYLAELQRSGGPAKTMTAGDELEEAMDGEAEKLRSNEKL